MMHSLVKNLNDKSKQRKAKKKPTVPPKVKKTSVPVPKISLPEGQSPEIKEETADTTLLVTETQHQIDSSPVETEPHYQEQDSKLPQDPGPESEPEDPGPSTQNEYHEHQVITSHEDDKIKNEAPESEDKEETPPAAENQGEDTRILGVLVERSDRLKTKTYIQHPRVIVLLLDQESGQFFKVSSKLRSMKGVDSKSLEMKPLETREHNLLEDNDSIPQWNQLLVLPIYISRLIDRTTNAILFFQLNESNLNRRIRLELYRAPKKSVNAEDDEKEVFYWWKSKSSRRIKYPSTLHIRTKTITPNQKNKREHHSSTLSLTAGGQQPENESSEVDENTLKSAPEPQEEVIVWSKYPGQPFKVPKQKSLTLGRSRFGSMNTKFSPNGRWLACATQSVSSFPVLIFTRDDRNPPCLQIPHGSHHTSLMGHNNLVYCIEWSHDSTMAVTSSADCTVRIWTVVNGVCHHVLPHSTYVYGAIHHPLHCSSTISAAADGILRVWMLDSPKPTIISEICEHKAVINSLRVSGDGKRLVTGDGLGVIALWSPTLADDGRPMVSLLRHIKLDNMSGSAINGLHLTSDNRTLIVVARDIPITVIDMRSSATKYTIPLRSEGLYIRGEVSPDDRWLYCGHATGQVTVHDIEDGHKVHEYADVMEEGVPINVSVHPLDHIIAVAYIGDSAAVIVYKSNPMELDGEPVAIKALKPKLDINRDIEELLIKHKELVASRMIERLIVGNEESESENIT